MPQLLRIKLREIGILRLMPKTFPLRAVQRQRAASASARPESREQHGAFEEPMVIGPKPSKSAHAASFRVSIGHFPLGLGLGGKGVFGVLGGGGQFGGGGGGFGFGQSPQALTRVKKIRFRTRK